MGDTDMNAISFWNEKREILKEQRKNDRKYIRLKKKAIKDGKDKEYLSNLNGEFGHYYHISEIELRDLFSRWYRYKSNKLKLPTYHGDSTVWEESTYTNEHILTDEGLAKLRSAIRNERHERFRGAFSWISIIIGLIGALTGLFAVIGK